MKGNVTGGIILLIAGAVIIAVGVSEKGKRIFNVLTDGQGSILGDSGSRDNTIDKGQERGKQSGSPTDPDTKSKNESASAFGMVGEKGAVALG